MDFHLTQDEEPVQQTVRELAQDQFKERAAEIDENSEFPAKNIEELAELGLLGSILDTKYGGAGSSTVMYSIILEEIAKTCASTSVIVSVTTMVGSAIENFGTEDQKSHFIPKIVEGNTLGAFCLTEPTAGSDPRRGRARSSCPRSRRREAAWGSPRARRESFPSRR